jgi:hypothetical protein
MRPSRILSSIVAIATLLTSGCASIVSKSEWPLTVKSNPPGAEAFIIDERGKEVHKGKTPMTVKLRSSDGFFHAATYDIELRLEGCETNRASITAKINGWYWGNILFGGFGLVGLVAIDPATGAMWKFPKEYAVELQPAAGSQTK